MVARKLGFAGCYGVDCVWSGQGRRGGLGLLWREECHIDIQTFSTNHIDAFVGKEEQWRVTGVYGFPEDGQKWKTWRLLDNLARGCNLHWLVLGILMRSSTIWRRRGGILGVNNVWWILRIV